MTVSAIGRPPIFSNTFVDVGQARGYWKKAGLDVTFRWFQRGTDTAKAVVTGDASVGFTATPPEVDESIRLLRAWCAADCGLAVNPDAVINQIEGGMIQSASWVLKEQVRFDNETAGPIDLESYPVLRFSEVPEIEIELLPSDSDVPLGVGEVTAGPMAAAIGNAVSHALGVRIRDLPLTRERIMATLLAQ